MTRLIIADVREGKELSQRALGEKMDPPTSQQAINQIENGQRDPSFSLLVRIAKALRVEVADLIEED